MFRSAQFATGESAVADMTAPFTPHSIPDLNINNFICFQRLTDRDPQQRICLAQTKKRVRFLTTDRRELFVFESARGCNAVDRRRSLGQPPTSPEPAADRGSLRPSFSKSPAGRTVKTSRTPTRDFRAAQTRNTCVAQASCPPIGRTRPVASL